MRKIILIMLLTGASLPAHAEDEAHRLDRLRTEALNRNAQAAVDRRDRANAATRARGSNAQDNYQRQLAEWRRRVADCRAGYYDACESR